MCRHGIGIGLTLAAVIALSGCSSSDDTGGTSGSTPMKPAPTTPAVAPRPASTGTIALSQPAEGATVGRSFAVKGVGSAFEGTLLWTLTGAEGAQTSSGYTTAGVTAAKAFQFIVEAPEAGSYTLTVYRESATSGVKTDAVRRKVTVR